MEQNELKELLLTLAAEAASSYDEILFERNSKFDEITLLVKKVEELKKENNSSVFSPRNSLASYDAINSLEKEIEKERVKLGELDSKCDSFLNRKEELLDGVELLDSILEEQRELEEERKEKESASEKEEASETEKPARDVPEKESAPSTGGEEAKGEESKVSQVLDALSFVAHQCGEIAEYTIKDPYRARNELRAIHVKFGSPIE